MKYLNPFNEEMTNYLTIHKMEDIIDSHLRNFTDDFKDSLWDIIDDFDLEYNKQIYGNIECITPTIRIFPKITTQEQIMSHDRDYVIDSFDFSYDVINKEMYHKEYQNLRRSNRLTHFLYHDYKIVILFHTRLFIRKKQSFEINNFEFNSKTMVSTIHTNNLGYMFKKEVNYENLNPLEKQLVQQAPIIKKNIDCEFILHIIPHRDSPRDSPEILFELFIPIK